MKKYYFLIIVTLILGLVLTGCSLLSNIGQAPANDQSEVSSLTKDDCDVECLAAPAVAGLLLEAAEVDNRYGTGKDGGNFIKDVANFMGPETDFNGVSKCSIIAYECAIAAFLNDPANNGDNDNYPAGVTSQYAGILDPEASFATFDDNGDLTGTMYLTVLDTCCGGGIEGLELADIKVDIQWVGLTDLFTLSAGGYWDIELVDTGNGEYEITFHRTGSVPYTRLWDVLVMGEIIEESLSVAVTNIYEAELESVVYEGTCNKFGTHLGETMTLTFSNNVAIPYDDQVKAETAVYFQDANLLGYNINYMIYTAEGNQVTIEVVGIFGGPRPEVGDFVTELNGIVDALEIPVKVPVDGVEVEGIVTYDLVGDWMSDLFIGAALNERFIIIETFVSGNVTGLCGVGYNPEGEPTGDITGTVVGQSINMLYEYYGSNYTATFEGTIEDCDYISGTWSDYARFDEPWVMYRTYY